MNVEPTIHDLYIREVVFEGDDTTSTLGLLRYDDHLLRRIGLVQLVKVRSDHPAPLRLRSVADELWVNIQGQVRYLWSDERSNSPTHGQKYSIDCFSPTLVLAPFGVAFGYQRLGGDTWLIRMATHSEGEVELERIETFEQTG